MTKPHITAYDSHQAALIDAITTSISPGKIVAFHYDHEVVPIYVPKVLSHTITPTGDIQKGGGFQKAVTVNYPAIVVVAKTDTSTSEIMVNALSLQKIVNGDGEIVWERKANDNETTASVPQVSGRAEDVIPTTTAAEEAGTTSAPDASPASQGEPNDDMPAVDAPTEGKDTPAPSDRKPE